MPPTMQNVWMAQAVHHGGVAGSTAEEPELQPSSTRSACVPEALRPDDAADRASCAGTETVPAGMYGWQQRAKQAQQAAGVAQHDASVAGTDVRVTAISAVPSMSQQSSLLLFMHHEQQPAQQEQLPGQRSASASLDASGSDSSQAASQLPAAPTSQLATRARSAAAKYEDKRQRAQARAQQAGWCCAILDMLVGRHFNIPYGKEVGTAAALPADAEAEQMRAAGWTDAAAVASAAALKWKTRCAAQTWLPCS